MKQTDTRKFYGKVADLRCIVCGADAEIHHITGVKHRGKGQKSTMVIPLCPMHHRIGGLGVAVHAGVRTWEANHGTQEELWEKTLARLDD